MKSYAVHSIPFEMTKPWILKRHYARRMPRITHSFGLFESGVLVGIATYGSPASFSLCENVCGIAWSSYVIELNRLVLLHNRKNEASFLVARTLRLLPRPSIVVSYADTGHQHIGYVYQATNWLYTGCTRRNSDRVTKMGHQRHNNHGDTFKLDRSPKHRYVYFVGSKKQIKAMQAALTFEVAPYPKGDSLNYTVSPTDIVGRQALLFTDCDLSCQEENHE